MFCAPRVETAIRRAVALRRWSLASILLLAGATAFAQQQPPGQQPPGQQPPGQRPPNNGANGFGEPLAGLTADQLAAFRAGRADFQEVETPADGLGPIFNRESCAACHSGPAVGGASRITVTRFGRNNNGVFDALVALGGSLLQDRSIDRQIIERIPAQANVVARRQTTPLFGLGLIEAIPDATILRGVRATPVNGVRGKASMVNDVATGRTMVGRFGWKGQHATLLSFAGDAYLNEMGITNRLFPTENAPNGNTAALQRLDRVADPEDEVDEDTGKAGVDLLTDYMRFLAPPPVLPQNASTVFGAKIFMDVGCTACHTPFMTTGNSNIAALNNKTVMLYSDLLLHDMGRLGDGIVQGNAGAREIKTPPLWGLRASGPYLHDGRANTVLEAITAHDGEAATSRTLFMTLSPDQQALLIQFLNSI